MGRPINKRFFGANTDNNIKVQFNNGTTSVKGYILKQLGTKKFKCEDADGNVSICRLVDKASGDLQPGEMSITLKADDGTVSHAVKISQNLVTVNYSGINAITGQSSTGYGQAKWSFDTSTDDTYWQIEEAGTNAAMDESTDLEGDDAPPFNLLTDYPLAGQGTTLASVALGGVTYVSRSPAEPSVSKTDAEITGYGTGIRRDKYDGNFSTSGNMSNENLWNYNFFDSATFLAEIYDTKINFGGNSDLPEQGGNHFSLRWRGWIKAPSAGDWNFYAMSDDQVAIWIGSDAQATPVSASSALLAHAGGDLPSGATNVGNGVSKTSVTFAAGKWYPIQIWFGEFGGSCQCEIFAQKSDGTIAAMKDFSLKYNPQGIW